MTNADNTEIATACRIIRDAESARAGLEHLEQIGFSVLECCLWGEDADATLRGPSGNTFTVSL
jgi:hypothetical protein